MKNKMLKCLPLTELLKVRDALRIVSTYLDIKSIKALQKEIVDELDKLKGEED